MTRRCDLRCMGDATKAVLKLDPSTRMAVVLHDYCGMKAREIARVQGVPSATGLEKVGEKDDEG